MTQSRDSNFTI